MLGQRVSDYGPAHLCGVAQQEGVEGEEHLERALRAGRLQPPRQQRTAVHEVQALCQPRELCHHCWQAHCQRCQPARHRDVLVTNI